MGDFVPSSCWFSGVFFHIYKHMFGWSHPYDRRELTAPSFPVPQVHNRWSRTRCLLATLVTRCGQDAALMGCWCDFWLLWSDFWCQVILQSGHPKVFWCTGGGSGAWFQVMRSWQSFDPLEAHPQPQVEEGAWREICFPGAFFSGMVGRIAKLQQQCNNLSLLR